MSLFADAAAPIRPSVAAVAAVGPAIVSYEYAATVVKIAAMMIVGHNTRYSADTSSM